MSFNLIVEMICLLTIWLPKLTAYHFIYINIYHLILHFTYKLFIIIFCLTYFLIYLCTFEIFYNPLEYFLIFFLDTCNIFVLLKIF